MGVRVAATTSPEVEQPPETAAFQSDKPNPKSPSPSPLRKRWSNIWLKSPNPSPKCNPSANNATLKRVLYAMNLQSALSSPKDTEKKAQDQPRIPSYLSDKTIDRTLLLSDKIMLQILAELPDSQRNANSLVCKRWLGLQDRLARSIRLSDWGFLQSGRLTSRFPNLTQANLISGSVASAQNSEIILSHKLFSVRISSRFSPELELLPTEVIDRGLDELASGCPNLRKLAVINASELGILSMAEECKTLQQLELHKCSDNVLRGIAACENLQVLKLVGNVGGFYDSVVSDIGLTILAQGCKRLVKLELRGCEGSFDGVKAIGQCCQMLEELILCDHKMERGWLAGLAYCENLKTLKFVSCKRIDDVGPGVEEYLGLCSALERLHLDKCQLRDKKTIRGLFGVCGNVREIVFQDCWGLENDVFSLATNCRRVKTVSLEGCSLVTTDCLESVILSWKELESLRVVSCKNIKDKDISPALSALFSLLKELKWRPDTKSLLPLGVLGTSIGKKGNKFFKRILDHKLLQFDL